MRELLERAGRRGHQALSAAVVADGTTAFESWSASGPGPDATALFEIGSITKAFTGVLLADMHLRGEVGLDDPLSRHLHGPLPAWREREPTLLELATHRSGLPNTPGPLARREVLFVLGVGDRDPWSEVDAERYAELLSHTSPRRAPGGRLRYSSTTTLALGAATIQGQSRRGRPRPPLEDLMPAAGSIRSNSTDMAAFLRACLSPGPDAPGPALALAQRPAHRLNRRLSVGLGWLIATPPRRSPVVWHNGGTWGFRSFAGFSTDRQRAVVVLSNTARSVDRLGWRLLDAD